MKKVLQQISSTLRSIHAESYHGMNDSKTIKYPYLTYDVTVEPLERNQDRYSLEIDLFGNTTSKLSVIELEEKLRDALRYRRDLTEDLGLRYSFQNSLPIPTLVPNLHRRNLTFYVKIDERTKNYGTA